MACINADLHIYNICTVYNMLMICTDLHAFLQKIYSKNYIYLDYVNDYSRSHS